LGVNKSATQKEIQQQYRVLCLKYHPDKNRDAGSEEGDFAFKEVQHAYSLIGTEDDRRKYDVTSRFSSYTRNSDFVNTDRFANQYNNFGAGGQSMYFKFGHNGPSFRFYHHPQFQRRYGQQFQFQSPYTRAQTFRDATSTSTMKRAHYVQKITVPLEELYTGGKMDLNLTRSIIERYKAAHRGGFLAPLVSQAALAVLTTWLKSQKINMFLSVFLFVTIVHFNLPPVPSKTMFTTMIKPGWKAGTKIKYKVDEGCVSDVTFVVQEGEHDIYKRVGNDLHASISIKAKRLRRGCTVFIDSLSHQEDPIKLKLRRGQVTEDGQIVVVEGQGWPVTNTGRCGDLHVKIRIK
jgi:DnaJ-class molecular chaperone